MNSRLGIVLAGAAILILGGAVMLMSSSSTPTPPTQVPSTPTSALPLESVVKLTSAGFSPKEVRVKAGNAVRFSNEFKLASINSDDHPTHLKNPEINLGEFPKGTTLSHIFKKKGIYSYHNHNNPAQKGVIIVE